MPWGSLPDEVDVNGALPQVDLGNVAYNHWTIQVSLRIDGMGREPWDNALTQSNGAGSYTVGSDPVHDATLHRMFLSRSAPGLFISNAFMIRLTSLF